MWAGMYSQEDYKDKKSQQTITGLSTIKRRMLRQHGFLEPVDPEFHQVWEKWQEFQKVCSGDLNVDVGGMTIRDVWIEETIKPAIKEAMYRAGHV